MLRSSRSSRRSRDEEEPADESAGPDLDVPVSGRSALRCWLALAVPVVACTLAGSKEPWAMGIVALVVALNLAATAPRIAIAKSIRWPLMAIALLPLAAFLPGSPAALPPWRVAFEQDLGGHLSQLRSPQPWVTFESWLLLLLGLAWAWQCLGAGFNEEERRWLVRWLAVFAAAIAATAVLLKRQGIEVPFWRAKWGLDYFGPFPNRNNFGGLLAMGAVLSFAAAYDAHRRRNPAWLFYGALFVPLMAALVSNTSRAGVILFFAASVAWMSLASFGRRSAQRIGIAAAVILALIAALILFGGHILERFATAAPEGTSLESAITSSTRMKIWEDCLRMIAQNPWAGVGLGNFEPFFVLAQTNYFDINPNLEVRYIHPESDWWWLATEAGLPAVFLLTAAIIGVIRRTGPWKGSHESSGRKDRRLRNACTVAALIAPVQGLVDTPGHSLGVSFLAILLAGLSLRPRRRDALATPASGWWMRRLPLATGCAALGALWLGFSAGFPLLPGDSAATWWHRRSLGLQSKGDLMGAYEATNRAVALKPLQWDYYYDRASLALSLGFPPRTALDDFSRARFLEPNSAKICEGEARLWLQYYPEYMPAAVREAMRRRPGASLGRYTSALEALNTHPELRKPLRFLASEPRLKLAYLAYADKDELAAVLTDLLEADPSLKSFSREERLRLFWRWYQAGDREAILNRLQSDALWRADGWPVLAEARAAQGDFRGALQLALEHLPPPAETTGTRKDDISQLRRDFLFHPTDFTYGFMLYEAEKGKAMVSDALVTLDKIAQLPGAPPRVLFEQAVMLSRKGDHRGAWEKMRAYIEKWQAMEREAPSRLTGASAAATKAEAMKLLKEGGPR